MANEIKLLEDIKALRGEVGKELDELRGYL